ncbi:hypothetical protein ABEX08_13560 [Priestia megaterium]
MASPLASICNLMKLETTIEEYREYWILGGTLWFDDKKKPKDWDFKQQLANINIRD